MAAKTYVTAVASTAPTKAEITVANSLFVIDDRVYWKGQRIDDVTVNSMARTPFETDLELTVLGQSFRLRSRQPELIEFDGESIKHYPTPSYVDYDAKTDRISLNEAY